MYCAYVRSISMYVLCTPSKRSLTKKKIAMSKRTFKYPRDCNNTQSQSKHKPISATQKTCTVNSVIWGLCLVLT